MKITSLLLVTTIPLATPAAFAQMNHGSHAGHAMADAPAKSAPPSEGTVRKIDKAAGKITIAHGPLENLGMPAMTMAFRASEAAVLDKLKVGDKIRFVAERVDGAFGVKQVEVVN